MDSLSGIAALATPVALAVMGAAIAFWPPDPAGYGKWCWMFAFAIVGAIAVITSWRSNQSARADIARMITGGDEYCFFRVMPEDLKVGSGLFQLYLDATGSVYDVNYWISPASANRNNRDRAYGSIDVRKPLLAVVYKGPHAWDRGLPLGDYFIEFDGRNGFWLERLTLSESNGTIIEYIQVTKGDRKFEVTYP